MSGSNPFRRNQSAQLANQAPNVNTADEALASAAHRFPSLDTDIVRSSPKAKGKTVRIVSPHSSTSDSEEEPSSPSLFSNPATQHKLGLEAAAPRPSALHSADAPIDPFGAESASSDTSEEDSPSESRKNAGIGPLEALRVSSLSNAPNRSTTFDQLANYNQNEYRKSAARPQPSRPPGTLDIPSSPFAHTSSLTQQTASKLTDSPTSSAATKIKPHLDVDAFKRLLLTGDKDGSTSTPSTPPPNTLPLQYMHGDSSSNTDASSLSRQSILDSQTDLRLETPRTSHEISPSEEERQFQLSPRSKPERFAPPVPRSRGTKTGKGNQPNSPTSIDPMLSTPISKQPTSSYPKLVTDLNKPLPPAPGLNSPKSRAHNSPDILPSTDILASDPPAVTNTRPRIAPLPPMSRRHSQYRSKNASTNQAASTSIEEERSADLQAGIPSPVTSKAPAPPPPRRRATDRHPSLSEFPKLQPYTMNVVQSTPNASVTKPSPPPSRALSVSSSKPRSRASPSSSISSSMAPPPPPRRRGSSGSSFGSRRVSTETQAVEGEGRGSISTVPKPIENVASRGKTSEKDILADLSALQREVDALREKYKRRGSADQA